MLFPELDLTTRVAWLFLLFGTYAALDLAAARSGWRWGTSNRWRELGAVLLAALAGGALGFGFCAATFALEPLYFSFGQGLGQGPGLERRVLEVGAQAGAFGGALIGCWMLCACGHRGRSRMELGQAARTLAEIGPYVIAGALSGGLVGSFILGPSFLPQFRLHFDENERYRMGVVWALTNGALLGSVVGAFLATRRLRRRLRPAVPVRRAARFEG